jgi:hypothetical protein
MFTEEPSYEWEVMLFFMEALGTCDAHDAMREGVEYVR